MAVLQYILRKILSNIFINHYHIRGLHRLVFYHFFTDSLSSSSWQFLENVKVYKKVDLG